ncbi:hypothetical protein COO60DRAFT_1501769, partial [Scenedesmus sp. NREL 46B-D3]
MNRSPAGKRATVDAAVAAAANPFKPNLRFSDLFNADGISIAAISRESLARVSEVYVGCCDAATYICAYGGATMGMRASMISVQPHPGGFICHAEPILATPTLLAKVRGIGRGSSKSARSNHDAGNNSPCRSAGTSAAAGAYLAPADSKRPFNAGRGSSSAMRGRSSARGGIHSNRQAAAAEAAAGAGKGHKQHGGRASSSSRQAAAAAATPAAANPDREATAGEAAVHQHRGRARNRSEREAEAAAQNERGSGMMVDDKAPADGNGAVA